MPATNSLDVTIICTACQTDLHVHYEAAANHTDTGWHVTLALQVDPHICPANN